MGGELGDKLSATGAAGFSSIALWDREISEPIDRLRDRADLVRRSQLRVCSSKLRMFLVQLCDDVARDGNVMKLACRQRAFPGEGSHDVRSLVDNIENIGYAGDYTFEVYNDGNMRSDPLFVADMQCGASNGCKRRLKASPWLACAIAVPRLLEPSAPWFWRARREATVRI